ncbi:protein of unknown function [Taphrina deformans PYCC 5710]|uniref:Peroxin 26 n=1 Tax=Taphrina deformans (strain PYCC 5710 / ATCC 11124 / CBS 356.35 / IMI 108563 / JCM 9778 / NBRC 8474) TaxID=1097556 RepID=R4X6Z4_TAPDE|nr:protein of unknown function [Taphrina deformans PYCC 5710]|eukprot:CCG80771.1 protein of unknown function [Taphrina deformans PYCC 5710]
MPSLPALPLKNSSLTDTSALDALYNKATREYLSLNLSGALATVVVLRAQNLSQKLKRKCFTLYVAILDSTTSLSDAQLKTQLGREGMNVVDKLKSGSVWEEAEIYFASAMPTTIAISILHSLTRHMTDDTKLQHLAEAYLTSLDPESSASDSVSELYALHVLPRCKEWEAARLYIEDCGLPDEKRELWLAALVKRRADLEETKSRLAKEAEERHKAEAEAKKLREIRKSKANSKKSSASANGSKNGSVILPSNGTVSNANSSNTTSVNNQEVKATSATDAQRTISSLSFLSRWTKSLTFHFSPRIIQTLLFLALLSGAAGRKEIREKIRAALRRTGSTIAAGFKVSYI